ncbi:cytochrome P450 [Paraburkholderia sp. MM5384-R2]|uniref:cytochrome P450 n=1 Tax=Paraburkholderia sp. MM5384-R2 TaxID=2723097 RepID=UPI0021A583F7|nr:cytochrome P450 [Paraburkholderia sp. MM5384-R2]
MWEEMPSLMVFGHANVNTVFGDGVTFSNGIMQRIFADSFGRSINGMDPPEHTRYRRLFQRAFMPTTIAKWGSELVPRVVAERINCFAENGRADLVSEFTLQYPFDVIYEQLRLPAQERAAFQRLAVGLMCIMVDYPHALEASRKMGEYFQMLLEERRAQCEVDGDLVSMLAHAEVDGDRLPDDVAVSFLRQLMNAAGDTTYRSTGSLLAALLTHPEQLEVVRRDRSLVGPAIDETLRWEGPLTVLTREAACDTTVDGVAVPCGTKIDVVVGSANRDPARYDDPDNFNIMRKQERHMAFAYGPHVCIGQHLARLEMERALNALLDRFPRLRLDPDQPVPKVIGLNSRAPDKLCVRFD